MYLVVEIFDRQSTYDMAQLSKPQLLVYILPHTIKFDVSLVVYMKYTYAGSQESADLSWRGVLQRQEKTHILGIQQWPWYIVVQQKVPRRDTVCTLHRVKNATDDSGYF